MCPLASPRLALPCLEFHSRSRCTTMCSQWESDERARTCVCNTHTHTLLYTLSLTHTLHSCLPWDFVSLSVPVPVYSLLPFALCPLFPILPFCTCHGNIYRHFFLPLFLGEFSCSTRLLLFSFFVLISFPLLFRSHTFTPLFLTVFAKCCQMFAVFPVVYFEALQNVAGFL